MTLWHDSGTGREIDGRGGAHSRLGRSASTGTGIDLKKRTTTRERAVYNDNTYGNEYVRTARELLMEESALVEKPLREENMEAALTFAEHRNQPSQDLMAWA
jgi:hypothetical protein